MGKEMHTGEIWRKAIPKARDRMQSQLLVAIVGALLLGSIIGTLLLTRPTADRFPAFALGAIAVSLGFAVLVWMLKAATPAAAACGGMICLLLTYWTGSFTLSVGRSALSPLAVLFFLTFLSTRAGRKRKAKAGLAEGRRGRSAAQVIANLSFAALCVTPWMAKLIERWIPYCCTSGTANPWVDWTMKVMCLAALAEATADTVSSEIGQAYGGAPVMLLSLRRVEPGVDGAITLLGTLAGAAGAALVAFAGVWAMHLHAREAFVALAAGSCGLFFDSLLGATLERKGWIGNDLVNFSSTAFAAALAALLYRYVIL
jgi:uncharacterized protein (TIGR00297 family)